VGVVREGAALAAAVGRLAELAAAHPRLAGEAANLLTVGRLIATAAHLRRESRGSHFRSDHPAPDPAWERRLSLALSARGDVVELGEGETTAAGEPMRVVAAAGAQR
jgi:L-aspartate oxidase